MINKVTTGAFLVYLIVQLACTVETVSAESDTIDISLDPIYFRLKAGMPIQPSYELQLFSTVDYSGVRADFSDLSSENEARPIPAKAFTMVPASFDLTANVPTKVSVAMNLTGIDLQGYAAGNYTGRMVLFSNNMTAPVPLTVQIRPDDAFAFGPFPLIAYVVVGGGVIAGFSTNYLKQRLGDERTMAKALNEAIASYEKARLEKRGTMDYFQEGYIKFKEGVQLRAYRNHATAAERFKAAKGYWDAMKGDTLLDRIDFEKAVKDIEKEMKESALNPNRSSLFKQSRIYVILLVGMLVVAIVTTWQGVAPEIALFDDPLRDGVAAFLFGFGSQALLQYVAPIITGKQEQSED